MLIPGDCNGKISSAQSLEGITDCFLKIQLKMAETLTTKVKRLPRDPRRPIKPMSSFLHYFQMHHHDIPSHPRMRFHIQSAMAKVAGEMWSKAKGEERKAAYRAAKKI